MQTPMKFHLVLLILKLPLYWDQNLADTLGIYIDYEIVATIPYNTVAPQTNECCDFSSLTNVDIEGLVFDVENNLIQSISNFEKIRKKSYFNTFFN